MKIFRLALLGLSLGACTSSSPSSTPDAGPPVPVAVPAAPAARISPIERARRIAARPKPPTDTRSDAEITQAACQGASGWRCAGSKPKLATATTQPVFPSSWTVPNWFLDPNNGTGCASDNNNGTSATCGALGVGPLRTWGELNVHRWGCLGNPIACPQLRQDTTVNFLSSQPDNSDPVAFTPLLGNGATASIVGRLLSATSTTLTGVTPKNRSVGANSPLNVVFGAPITPGTNPLVQNNAVGKSSMAWVWTTTGAITMTQPLVPSTIGGTLAPAEVDTWAPTDPVQRWTLTQVNLVKVQPTVDNLSLSEVNLFHLNVHAYTANFDSLSLSGDAVVSQESVFEKFITGPSAFLEFINCLLSGGGFFTGPTGWNGGGANKSGSIDIESLGINNPTFMDGDILLGEPPFSSVTINGGQTLWGFVYIGWFVEIGPTGRVSLQTLNYGGHVVYANPGGFFKLLGVAQLNNNSDAGFVPAITGAQFYSPGIILNELATANSETTSGGVMTIHTGIHLTPATLDVSAPDGGFGGLAWQYAGASIDNR
jgi:hypothetical protein